MEAGSVGTKLRPKPSTSVSDSWWEVGGIVGGKRNLLWFYF